MKQLLFAFCLMCLTSKTQAQQYQPLAADSTLWIEYITGSGNVNRIGYLILGDTLHQNQSYLKLFKLAFVGYTKEISSYQLIALIREQNKKVYLIPLNQTICKCNPAIESLIYDFDVLVGDSVRSQLIHPSRSEQFYIVHQTDQIQLPWGQQVYDKHSNNTLISEVVIHGIGRVSGLLSCFMDFGSPGHVLTNFERGDSIRNSYFPLSIERLATRLNMTVYPNPTSDFVYIKYEAKPGTALKLVSVTGQIMQEIELEINEPQYQLDLSGLSSGIYLIQLWENGQLLANEKLIRH